MRFLPYFLLIILTGFMVSCGTQSKINNNYLQAYSDSAHTDSSITIINPVIKRNDILSILIYSASTIPEVDALYNLPATGTIQGYLVDANGEIIIPRVGTVKAEGLTKQELSASIKSKLDSIGELTNPNVIVRFQGYAITVLGEVASPGRFQIPNERITIMEAIGMAGDLTLYARKSDVTIAREKDGLLEYGTVDLTSKDIVNSPYYFLSQNDLVIVNATKNKNRLNEQITTQRISIGLSIITSLALLYNIFKK